MELFLLIIVACLLLGSRTARGFLIFLILVPFALIGIFVFGVAIF